MRYIILDTETTGLDPDDGHKIIRNQFGGMFIFTYKKNVIPLTPQKVLFNKDYKVTSLVKNNL